MPSLSRPRLRHRPDSFVLDDEAVLLGVDGIADFNGLYSRKYDDEVQLYVFDILVSASDDLRPLPLHLRKNHLAKMLRRRIDASYFTEAKHVAPVHDTPQVQPRYNKSWWPDQLRIHGSVAPCGIGRSAAKRRNGNPHGHRTVILLSAGRSPARMKAGRGSLC